MVIIRATILLLVQVLVQTFTTLLSCLLPVPHLWDSRRLRHNGARYRHLLTMSHPASLRVLNIRDLLLPRVQRKPLVRLHVHRHLTEQRHAEQPRSGHTGHNEPHDAQAVRERRADLGAQGLVEGGDGRDGGVREGDACGKALDEGFRETFVQLVLEDGSADGDAPDLVAEKYQ